MRSPAEADRSPVAKRLRTFRCIRRYGNVPPHIHAPSRAQYKKTRKHEAKEVRSTSPVQACLPILFGTSAARYCAPFCTSSLFATLLQFAIIYRRQTDVNLLLHFPFAGYIQAIFAAIVSVMMISSIFTPNTADSTTRLSSAGIATPCCHL